MNSINRTLAITFKEIKQLSRDNLTFGMIIMIPVIQLLLFGFAINTNVRNIPVAIVDFSSTTLSRYISQSIEATKVVKFTKRYNSIYQAEKSLSEGKIRAILYIPSDLPTRMIQKRVFSSLENSSQFDIENRPLAQWIVDGTDTVIASAISSISNMPVIDANVFTKEQNRKPKNFEVVNLYNPEKRSVVNIVPGLIGIILTMTMVMFTSAAIVREKERGNIEFIISTPVSSLELMIGKIIPYIFIGLLQMTLILTLGHFIFDVPISGSLHNIFIVGLLFIFTSLTLGLLISSIAKTQLQSMQMTIFVLLPSILLSGFMFPYEGMPKIAQWIAEFFPATHFMRMIRSVVLRDASFSGLHHDIIWNIGFSILVLSISTFRFKKRLD
ncbi:MAG: ABC transporter permease [Francisellaceae bacterium]|nr:ABC transporter permease [Francisellaceae bacterium]MBT6207708.1 ABC transporter permease [Francisellaceae bacterium]MBT6538128.1 ABC transporter permease [Francisellaceae bacterium]